MDGMLSAEIKAACLAFEVRLEGMKAENRQREILGESLAYGECAFNHLQSQLLEQLMVIRRDYNLSQTRDK